MTKVLDNNGRVMELPPAVQACINAREAQKREYAAELMKENDRLREVIKELQEEIKIYSKMVSDIAASY